MKELTVQEKSKAYDEALERARKFYNDEQTRVGLTPIDLEYLFPELKESEDEQIRKFLIKWVQDNYYHGTTGIPTKTLIAWLEKQGDKDKLIQELGEYKVKYTQEVLNEYLNINNNDNEKLRKTTIDFLKEFADKGYENAIECIDWLEKQGNQKLPIEKLPEEMKSIRESLGFRTQKECDEYNKMVSDLIMSDDKDKPKFKVGDWITDGNITIQIEAIKNDCYLYCGNCVLYSTKTADKVYHLWTIQDAKPGDVLTYNNGAVEIILLFKEWKNGYIGAAHTYAHVFNNNININNWCDCGKDAHPATKEQCDLLFQKVKEAGYEWSEETMELKKIELSDVGHEYYSELLKNDKSNTIDDYAYQCVYCMSHDWALENPTWDDVQNACKLGAKWQKKHDVSGDWSEEDERMFKSLNKLLNEASCYSCTEGVDKILLWLKSFRPQSWTKEDKERFISCLKRLGSGNPEQPETINSKWFKEHVCPQNTWKPSDELDEVSYQIGIKRVLENPESYELTKYNWKPSDEQMEALYEETQKSDRIKDYRIVSLYNDLKKLKE